MSMRARSKPSPATTIRNLKRELRESLALIARYQRSADDLSVHLAEARRRSIPMRDGTELNFLPLYISAVKIERDVKQLRGENGSAVAIATGNVKVTIVADGDIVRHAAPVAPISERS